MIHLIFRKEIFSKSLLDDDFISRLQQSTYKQQRREPDAVFNIGESAIQEEVPVDHLKPFHNSRKVVNNFAVNGYKEKNRADFLIHRSMAFIRFFELMGINQLYLLDELKYDLVSFPFNNREKREAFKSIVNQATYSEGFELDIEELSTLLPLFYNSRRHSTPISWFFSANTQVPFAAFLCDDANFHASFPSQTCEKLISAASNAGLIIGGVEVCQM